MINIQQILEFQIGGNSVAELCIAIGVFLAVFIAMKVMRKHVVERMLKLSRRTNTKIDDVVTSFLKGIKTPVYLLIAFFVALQGIEVPESLNLIVHIAILVVVVSQVTTLLEEVFVMMLGAQFRKTNPASELPGIFRIGIRLILWSVGGLLILSNAGVDITSLIAGLGIGGLAISLALQGILSDLFASFSLAVDKPFEIGDFIIVGEHKGTVRHIGMKTTRLTALEGEEIVISNAELTSARVQNYKKMKKRRIIMSIGVTYDTTSEKIALANTIIKEAVSSHESVEFDRSHFKTFGDSALLYEIVFYMLTSDYAVYMDIQQAINVEIHKRFAEEGIEMAFPTQTVYVKKD